MTTKKQINNWIKQIEKRMLGVAAERDKIDEMIYTLKDVKQTCTKSYESLQEARDALSELV